jgi:hypothetical protein
MMY